MAAPLLGVVDNSSFSNSPRKCGQRGEAFTLKISSIIRFYFGGKRSGVKYENFFFLFFDKTHSAMFPGLNSMNI